MAAPRLEVNLPKIAHNASILKQLYGIKGIDIIGVTKAVCGNPWVAKTLVSSGIGVLADSRIANIKRMRRAGVSAKFMLLRTPMLSQVSEVIQYTNISLNTELSVIQKLSENALARNTTHAIILMVELGDLREGIMPQDLEGVVKKVLMLKGIELVGIGTNLACLGGIKPDEDNMNHLSLLAKDIEDKFRINLTYVTGGNSANYDWFINATTHGKINNLRLGESIFLGREPLQRKPILGLFTDAFTLVAEVIESKIKPSMPLGKVGQDAFGKLHVHEDLGDMQRAILAIGAQDIQVNGLTPKLDVDILGANSDHLVINVKEVSLEVGDEIEFSLNYAALISAMASIYILKKMSYAMNAVEYCSIIEEKDVLHKKLESGIKIRDDQSALVSLKDIGLKLIYEPSFYKDYNYMVREAIVEKIDRISRSLEKEDKVLIIRSAWRSFEHQKLLWENNVKVFRKKHPEKSMEEIKQIVSYFVAPETKSTHSTGGAVDALIYDLKKDAVMDFGTNDGLKIDLGKECYPHHPDINYEAKRNRKLLIGLFEKEDFVCDLKEYWHFDYGNVGWAIEKGRNISIYGAIGA